MKNLLSTMQDYIRDIRQNDQYNIVDIRKCELTRETLVTLRLAKRHTVTKKLSDVVCDDKLIQDFDVLTVRALTCLYVKERAQNYQEEGLFSEYEIVSEKMDPTLKTYLLDIKHKADRRVKTMTPKELIKDQAIVKKLSSDDACRIGYLAGSDEVVTELEGAVDD